MSRRLLLDYYPCVFLDHLKWATGCMLPIFTTLGRVKVSPCEAFFAATRCYRIHDVDKVP